MSKVITGTSRQRSVRLPLDVDAIIEKKASRAGVGYATIHKKIVVKAVRKAKRK